MAMGKCRECGAEVSDQAKTCPKCGVSKPVKKTSLLVKLLAGFIGLAVLGNIIGGMNGGSSTSSAGTAGTATPTVAKVDPKETALNAVKLEKWDWHKGGFDSVMLLNAKIKNEGTRDVKDLTIECRHASNSGTRIDSNKKVVYELVKAGKTVTIKDFSMGFIHSQATKTNCAITDLVLL